MACLQYHLRARHQKWWRLSARPIVPRTWEGGTACLRERSDSEPWPDSRSGERGSGCLPSERDPRLQRSDCFSPGL